ncbi:hypothetical protein BBJ28_00015609 [Nothophytophthora sp. Chile5]|nr:hypothetical protein BBJ28_00015609 [Nothophytophthora sp. Chile5]
MHTTLGQQPTAQGFFLGRSSIQPPETQRAAPSQDRPFACPIPTCGGRFHRKFTLHEHLKTHTGEQPHECPVAGCGKRFSTSGNLARHRKLHSVQKLNCPTPHCSRVFTSREKLVRHLKVHLAGTPHTCEFPDCGKTFSTAGNLTRHRRTRHNAGPASRTTMPTIQRPSPPRGLMLPGHQRQLPPQTLQPRLAHCPVPGAMLMKTPLWTTAPSAEVVPDSRPDCRISDQDVKDLLDCLFVENPAVATVSRVGGMIRSEPFLRGAYHQKI